MTAPSTSTPGVRATSPPDAILFDLDGTLVDSLGDIAAACNHALAHAGRSALPPEAVARFVGDGARHLMAGVLGASLHSAEVDAALATYLRFYTAHPADATRWMPHAPELLAALASRGVALALVTNKTRAVTVALMDRLGVTPRFRAVVAGGDAALKPSPEPVLRALEALGVPAEKAWMVGDAVQDIEAGRAAGCTTIAVAGGFQATERLAAAAPDHLVASLADVLALVEAVRPATTGSSAPSA